MELIRRSYRGEGDFRRMRNFLQTLFLRNETHVTEWHVAYLDHWRWHYIATCRECESVLKAVTLWETAEGVLAAFLTAICHDEIALHIHPDFYSIMLEAEMIAYAEDHYSDKTPVGEGRILYIPVPAGNFPREAILRERGYQKGRTWEHLWYRDLTLPVPEIGQPAGYMIRSMGDSDEYLARSWCSWRTFHENEPDNQYDGDSSWYGNMQSAPLYRHDLDLVAEAGDGSFAAFCTISYDDDTRSAFCTLRGTAPEHRLQHLDETLLVEGMNRLRSMGCKQLFVMATEEVEDELYRSVFHDKYVVDIWVKKNF